MVVYIYNHKVDEIKEDLPYLTDKPGPWLSGIGHGGNSKPETVIMMHYCEHCNSNLVGYWEYVDKYIQAVTWGEWWRGKAGKTIDYDIESKISNNLRDKGYIYLNHSFIEKLGKPDNINDCFYKIVSCKHGDVLNFTFDKKTKEELKPVITVSPKIKEYVKEIKDFFSMDTCPICGEKFEKKKNQHVYFYRYSDEKVYNNLNKKFPDHLFEKIDCNKKVIVSDTQDDVRLLSFDSMLEYFTCFSKKYSIEVANNKLEETVERFNIMPVSKTFDKSSFDSNALKNYLNHICLLESNVFSITERLKELYRVHFESENDASVSKLLLATDVKDKLKKAKEAYKNTEKINPDETVTLDDLNIKCPKRPTPPVLPAQPMLKTPGLFNKKKIEEENKLLIQEYNAKIAAYNAEVAVYTEKANSYNRKLEEIEKKRNEVYVERVNEAHRIKQEKLDGLNEEIKALNNKIKEIKNGDTDIVTPEMIKNELVESELREAEKTLSETYKALNELYSYDVIFGKYRNFVAVSTFYEYISSGRCTALEGADGAYNIYENEIKANMMISQLSQVIESLDKIQQNQFVVYSAIQESNRKLAQLNSSMNSAVSALNSIDVTTKNMSSTMEKISEHTAIAAYNSSVAAYYSKKNAELTNALGYMIAFK